MKNQDAQTLGCLQAVRAIAAWMVVFHHYMQGFHSFQSTSVIGRFFSKTGSFGVDIFFVLSGFIMVYILSYRPRQAGQFYLRRILRIVPVYWALTLLFIPILALFPTSLSHYLGWDLSSLALSLLFVPHDNPGDLGFYPLLTVGWTLNIEIFFYTWLSLMLLVFKKFWFAATVGTLAIFPMIWSSEWPYALVAGSSRIYEFVLGMVIAWGYVRLGATLTISNAKAAALSVLFGALGIVTYSYIECCEHLTLIERPDRLHKYASAAFFVLSALALNRFYQNNRFLRPLTRLGDMSYSTYLAHPLALIIALSVLGGSPSSTVDELLAFSVYTSLTLGFSMLSYRWIETGGISSVLRRFLIRPEEKRP
ncbi:MAG: exopolysaccharide production protein ExoZ [Gammaproteobacteria bacterium]|jgi:exopolysaccharide production protein ExoZ